MLHTRRFPRFLALGLTLVMLTAACGGDDDDTGAGAENDAGGEPASGETADTVDPKSLAGGPAPTSPDTAQNLRISLQDALQQHVFLTAAATDAALGKRDGDFKAIKSTLDGNGLDLQVAFERSFGAKVGTAFTPLWAKHITMVVDYTTGVATNDQAKKDKAVADLTEYTTDFGAFVNSVLPELPVEAVAELVKTHILTLKEVIDAQGAKNLAGAYTALTTAGNHMGMIAEGLASAIVKKFPQRMTGNVAAPALTLQAQLSAALSENAYLLTEATGAAIGKRPEQVTAVTAALAANNAAISGLIKQAGGDKAAAAFDPEWKKHVDLFIEFGSALGAGDKAKSAAALSALGGDELVFKGFTLDFGNAVGSVLTGATATQYSEGARSLVQPLKDAINNQGVKQPSLVYPNVKTAAGNSSKLAALIAAAVSKQFPDKYPA